VVPGTDDPGQRARRAVAIAKRIFTPVAIGFLALAAWTSRDLLGALARSATASGLLAAVGLWLLAHFLSPLFAWSVLRSVGARVTYRAAWLIHCRRLPARYLPGGIWHTVARYADFKSLELTDRQLLAWVLLENALAAGVTLLAGGLIVHAVAPDSRWAWLGSAAAAIAALGLLLTPLAAKLPRFAGLTSVGLSAYIRHVAIVTAFWCVAGVAFVCYFSSLAALPDAAGPFRVFGAYLLAWGIGFVSFFAPQGIGVFEAIAADLLKADLGWMSAAAMIAGFRVVVLCADLLAWALSLLVGRNQP
jgi:glycosyltransferase 2 family protein